MSLPGVPSILNSMIENCKIYLIQGAKIHSKTLNLYTVESKISKDLGEIQKKFKKYVEVGSYPFFQAGKLGVSIVIRSEDKNKIEVCNSQILKFVKEKKIEVVDR